jgi:hypothetical protein
MENLRKKNRTEILEIKWQSSKLEQEADRISELEDKIDVRGKNKTTLSQLTKKM